MEAQQPKKGSMTVSEAGRRGGESTKRVRGPEFYHRIGQMGGRTGGRRGGERVRELIEKGKEERQS